MKKILFFTIVIQILFSCEKKIEINKKQTIKKDSNITIEKIYGDLQLNKKYNSLPKVEIFNDSLSGNNFLNQNFKKVKCECIIKSDYYDDVEKFMIRETEILIQDKIKLSVFYKSEQKYIYVYNHIPLKIKNYYGEMYNSDSDINFFFDNRDCYEISKSKFLMREQPSRWSGLANQYDIYQIVDLDKMELIQFAERDDKVK